ncbi:MAG: ABC transporter ATP-binding protein [Ruminococcus sp.]|nr:ABC transporter ATP-binding protein [Ruminococcus sp.]
MKEAILTAKKLCKSFAANGVQNHVLTGIDLEVYRGDFTVVMGASGSGKSTLLYALSGMDRATSGEVIYGGKDLVKLSEKELTLLRRKDFGFVFQKMHLVSNMTMFENVTVPAYLDKTVPARDTDEKAQELFKTMGIADVMKHLPSQCSGGEQQRCAIIRAVISKPAVLFADEPTGALNRRNTTEVLDLLTRLNAEGQSVFMVTHDIRAAVRGSRIIYIEDGKISGELTLPHYEQESEQSRETQVNSWLTSMHW